MKKITILSIVLVLFLAGCQDAQLIPPQFRFYEVLGYPELEIQQCTKNEIRSPYIYTYASDSVINILIDAIGPSDYVSFMGWVQYYLTKPDGTSVHLNSLLGAETYEEAPIRFRLLVQSTGVRAEEKTLLSLSLNDCKPGNGYDVYKLTVSYAWYRNVERSLYIYVLPEGEYPPIGMSIRSLNPQIQGDSISVLF